MSSEAAKKAARKKLLARLGIQSKDLLSAALSPLGGGCMRWNEYRMFWEQVDSPSDATWFLSEIAAHINKQLEAWKGGRGAPESDSTKEGNSSSGGGGLASPGVGGWGVSLDALMTTFNFILQNLEILTADKRVKEVHAQWTRIEAAQSGGRNPLANQHPSFAQCKELYRLLHMRVENQELIGPIILNCISMYSSIKEFERMMDVLQFSTLDDAVDLKGGESAFYYEYLKRLARDGQAIPNTTTIGKTPVPTGHYTTPPTPQAQLSLILSNIVSKFVTLPQQMKMNPKVAETTFCALYHILRNIMTIQAVTDANLLRMALSTLQPFYLWPLPYGTATRELLIQLQEEALLPGSMLRARLHQEVHTACYFDADAAGGAGELTSPLFYLHAQDEPTTQAYVNMLDLKPFKLQTLRKAPAYTTDADDIPALLTPVTQALTILNLLACEPSLSSGVEEDVASIRNCNAIDVFRCYQRVQHMIRDVQERPTESKEIRVGTLMEVRGMLREAAVMSDKSDLVKLPEKLSAPFTPALPTMAHLSIPIPNSSTFHFDARDQWRAIGHHTAPLVSVPLQEQLEALLGMYRDPNRVTPLTVRIMIAGGDEVLHQVVCAWVAINQASPEVLQGVRPRFYLLPFSKNHMGAFLARHDSWYNRHVYVPSRSHAFMLPWVRMEQGELGDSTPTGPSTGGAAAAAMEEEGAELPPPGQFFRRTFESYAREASLTLDPYLYQLEGFLTADSEGLRPAPTIPGPDHTVPFIQRFELGILPSAWEHKKFKRLAEGIKVEELIAGSTPAARQFEYQPVEIVVRLTKMDLQGRITEVLTEEAAPYQHIVVSSVPRKHDLTFPPNPTYPNMEMHAKLHKSHSAAKASLSRKSVLSSEPKQHVIEVEVWAANPNHTFGVMVDGQYFGPYYRIKLLPCFKQNAEGEHMEGGPKRMNFPIQTFFPVDM